MNEKHREIALEYGQLLAERQKLGYGEETINLDKASEIDQRLAEIEKETGLSKVSLLPLAAETHKVRAS